MIAQVPTVPVTMPGAMVTAGPLGMPNSLRVTVANDAPLRVECANAPTACVCPSAVEQYNAIVRAWDSVYSAAKAACLGVLDDHAGTLCAPAAPRPWEYDARSGLLGAGGLGTAIVLGLALAVATRRWVR